MLFFNKIYLLPVVLFSLLLSSVSAAPLVLCYEDVPQYPWTMPDNTGLNIVLLHRVEKLLNESFVVQSKPWKRCQEETRQGVVDGYFASANTEERRKISVFPTHLNGTADTSAYMYEDTFDIYIRKGSGVHWDGTKFDNLHRPIIVQRGYYVATALRQKGVEVDERVKSADDGLRLVANNLADVAVLQGREAQLLATSDPRFKDTVETVTTPYLALPLYLAIGLRTYEQNPKRIEAIWKAIIQVRESPEYQLLLNKVKKPGVVEDQAR